MSVLVYPDLAQAILRDLSDFSPIELMSLARVCTSFRSYIKKLLPDYGVKQNLQTLLLLLGFKMEVDEIVKYNLFIFWIHFVVSTSHEKRKGCFLSK